MTVGVSGMTVDGHGMRSRCDAVLRPGSRLRACRAAPAAILTAALSGALLVLVCVAQPAPAQDPPAQLSLTVVPPKDAGAPRPTGSVIVSVNDRVVATIPLVPGTGPLTAVTPLTAGTFAVLGQKVTISYSGDSNYEASDGVTVTIPTPSGLTITARPKDTAAPSIDITSPGDGLRYEVGEALLAIYACKDPGDRSPVTTCAGPVASGAAIDTSEAGAFSFEVSSADALGNAATKSVTFQVGGEAGAANPPPPPAAGSGGSDSPPPPARPAPSAPGSPAAAQPAPAGGPGSAPGPADADSSSPAPAPRAESRPGDSPRTSNDTATDTRTPQAEYKPYDPRSEPAKVVATFVAGFALLQLGAGGGGLALAGRKREGRGASRRKRGHPGSGGGQQSSPKSESVDYGGLDVQYIGGVAAVAAGDRSGTWRWPGTRAVDALAIYLGDRLAPRSPLIARLVTDGTGMRAIFGAPWQLVPVAGLVLGILAVRDTGGEAVPPGAALTIAIIVISVIDGGAGMVAAATFLVGVIAHGGPNTDNELRLLLGLTALWCVVPVVAHAARPLRRDAARGPEQTWDRAADFVIAALVGAWTVQLIVGALPGLAGKELAIADDANTAAYWVLAALLLRLGLETVAAHLYPLRVTVAHPEELADPPALQRLLATAWRTSVFLFLAYVVVGTSWQLWVGTALFVIPQILSIYEDRLPNSPSLYRVLPKGLVELVLMLLVGAAVGALLLSSMNEKAPDFLATTFVLLALPGFALSLVALFARDGDEPRIGWGKRLAGVGLVVLGVLLALGAVF